MKREYIVVQPKDYEPEPLVIHYDGIHEWDDGNHDTRDREEDEEGPTFFELLENYSTINNKTNK